MKQMIVIFMLLGLVVFASHGLAQEAPLTNADVVKLCKVGIGDEIVIAKINQVKTVNFNMDTDALVSLKENGVSKDVIAAMLKRSTTPQNTQNIAATAPQLQSRIESPMDVTLSIKSGDALLLPERGETKFVGFAGFGATHIVYPGSRSRSRITEKLPALLLRLDYSPGERAFLVKLDSDQGSDARILRVVSRNMNPFSSDRDFGPNNDSTIPYDATEVTLGHWKLTPKNKLTPGEYGLFFHFMLWSFGVDPE